MLIETIERVAPLLDHRIIEYGLRRGPGWLDVSELLSGGGALDDWVAAVSARHGGGPQVAASFVTGWLAGAMAAPAIGAFVVDRRVPDLAGATLHVHVNEDGWTDRISIAGSVLAVRSDDPAAARPGVSVAGGDDALVDCLAGVLVEALRPFVEAIGARTRLGRRGLWGNVADAFATVFLHLGDGLGDQETARAEADRFFDAATPPLQARPSWVRVEHAHHKHLFVRRGACCLAYTSPQYGYCTTCPFTPDAECERRLQASLTGCRRLDGGDTPT